ncbi:MAG: hypothetical protein ACK5M7_03970 [Draconibacterium sp.]
MLVWVLFSMAASVVCVEMASPDSHRHCKNVPRTGKQAVKKSSYLLLMAKASHRIYAVTTGLKPGAKNSSCILIRA